MAAPDQFEGSWHILAPHLLQRGQTLHTAPQTFALRPSQVLRDVAQPRLRAVGRRSPVLGVATGAALHQRLRAAERSQLGAAKGDVLQQLSAIAGGGGTSENQAMQGDGAEKHGEAT